MTTARNVLSSTLAILGNEGDGWVQGTNREENSDGTMRYCLFGAIGSVRGQENDDDNYFAEMEAFVAVGEEYGSDGEETNTPLLNCLLDAADEIAPGWRATGINPVYPHKRTATGLQSWQDNSETEWSQVKAVLDRAIALAEERGV